MSKNSVLGAMALTAGVVLLSDGYAGRYRDVLTAKVSGAPVPASTTTGPGLGTRLLALGVVSGVLLIASENDQWSGPGNALAVVIAGGVAVKKGQAAWTQLQDFLGVNIGGTPGTVPLPPAPGGQPTPNTPVNAGPAGLGPSGQPSTLNGPAAKSQLFNDLFPGQT